MFGFVKGPIGTMGVWAGGRAWAFETGWSGLATRRARSALRGAGGAFVRVRLSQGRAGGESPIRLHLDQVGLSWSWRVAWMVRREVATIWGLVWR